MNLKFFCDWKKFNRFIFHIDITKKFSSWRAKKYRDVETWWCWSSKLMKNLFEKDKRFWTTFDVNHTNQKGFFNFQIVKKYWTQLNHVYKMLTREFFSFFFCFVDFFFRMNIFASNVDLFFVILTIFQFIFLEYRLTVIEIIKQINFHWNNKMLLYAFQFSRTIRSSKRFLHEKINVFWCRKT